MIGRRALLLAGATLAARHAIAGLPVPVTGSLGFRITRRGSEIGSHTITFEHAGDVLKVHTAVDVLVTLLSIPVARYKHRSAETWQGTTLVALVGETNRIGHADWMQARRNEAGLVVVGSHTERYIAPDSAMPVSYWNKRMLDGPMISLEDGALLSPTVADLNMDNVKLASGRAIQATHYNLSNPVDTDLWYDETNTWAAMRLTVVDGSEIHYERL